MPPARFFALAAALALWAPACWGEPALAQTELAAAFPDAPQPPGGAPGSIRGSVTDPDGALYEGVRVTLVEPLPEKTASTDANGRFEFDAVPAGPFRLKVEAGGFATQTRLGTVQAGQAVEISPIVLLVAAATSEVDVSASPSRLEVAEARLEEEEKQRVFGFLPNFYVVYESDAPALSSRQKFRLAWRSSIDPVTFGITGVIAGAQQATNAFRGYGQGAQGYGKRFGANYADNFIGTMIGGAILPSLWKQDPRYFYKGTGTVRSRVLYALANAVMCKGDNGRWQVNYSGIVGGLAGGGISNLYYPASDRNGAGLTVENTLLGIGGSAVQNLFQEFLIRKLTPKAPKTAASQP